MATKANDLWRSERARTKASRFLPFFSYFFSASQKTKKSEAEAEKFDNGFVLFFV
jgi:hypothetical protein